MPPKTTEQKLSRVDIAASVAEMIAEQGLESITMRNIAKYVGCSVGTLPHYFDGKEDIVIAALNWSNERVLGRLSNMTLEEVNLENLYPLISITMPTDQLSDIEWRVRLCLWDSAATNRDMRASVKLISDSAMQILEDIVQKLQRNGEIKPEQDSNTIALTLYHICIGTGFNMLHTSMKEREQHLKPLLTYIESIQA